MQQEKIQLENSKEIGTLETMVPAESLPYGRRETIFTMIGVLSVVFLAMLDQITVLTAIPRMIGDV
jgi:threonine/homoserine/homoserine lactone efflux protein